MAYPQIQVANSPALKRVARRPQHTFQLRQKPYQIQPFMLAPVLPGETLKNVLLQARVVTDPIKNPLIGWWMEYYFFYVRLRDLNERETVEDLVLDISADTSSLNDGTAKANHYHHSGINWTKMCLDRVVDEYFRDEGEAVNVATIGGLPIAAVAGNSWLDSVYRADEIPDDTIDGSTTPVQFDEWEKKYNTWLMLRQQKMTEMDFEDYLGTFGVRTTLAQKNKPELIRFVREWSYPSNTINPTDGTPSSAVSWSIAERADKDRFFAEPGFIVGVSVARPKVYMGKQRESAAHLLNDAFSWLPAVMREQAETSLKQVAAGTGPLGGLHTANAYWVDIRDLFLYGDQYVNFALTETDAGMVALPSTTNSLSRYASEADVDALFSSNTRELVRSDGIVNMTILGTQIDQT